MMRLNDSGLAAWGARFIARIGGSNYYAIDFGSDVEIYGAGTDGIYTDISLLCLAPWKRQYLRKLLELGA